MAELAILYLLNCLGCVQNYSPKSSLLQAAQDRFYESILSLPGSYVV